MTIDERLEELGLTLPPAAAPVAAYVPVVIDGRRAKACRSMKGSRRRALAD